MLRPCVLLLLAPLLVASPASAGDPARPDGSTPPEADAAARFWPQWRGPLATGVAPFGDPPVSWSETENVRFKIALPGKGHSSPIVWGERIFLTTAVPVGDPLPPRYAEVPGAHDNLPITHRYELVVLAVSRRDGTILWQRTVRRLLPHEMGHFTASLASASPVTDGDGLYVSFGSGGIYALDLDGEIRWHKDLGRMHTKHAHGEGSSPALYEGTLIVNWDHEGDSFLVAFDAASGEERWRVPRPEPTSWATPIVVEVEGKPQVIVSGTERVRGYDLASGAVIWACGGMSGNVVASPVAADGMVFAGSSYEKQAMLAIRLAGARGELTGGEHVAWSRRKGTPYVPSPLLYDGSLYFLRHYQGILTRVEAASGVERGGPYRLPGIRSVYASPVAAAGRIYVTDRQGTTLVLSHEDEPRVLALNRLDDHVNASAAIAGRDLYLRGERFLYCLTDATARD